MLNRRRKKPKGANKEKVPEPKPNKATKDPCQSLEVGKVTHDWQAGEAAPAQMWCGKPWQHGDGPLWRVRLGLRTSPYSPAVFQCFASMTRAAIPQLYRNCARSVPERLHSTPPHAQAVAGALPCQGQWEFLSLTLVQAGFPPMDTHTSSRMHVHVSVCVYT